MQYMGSKNRIAKLLLPTLLRNRRPGQWYVEPFMGGCNMLDKVPGPLRWGNDVNPFLVAMFKALQRGWVPPTSVSRETFFDIRENEENYPPEFIAFVRFNCTFGGAWKGGYAYNAKGDNYADRGSRVLTKQIQNLREVWFTNQNYWQLAIPPRSLIYCDPPYAGTPGYRDAFDHDSFWLWARIMSSSGHTLYVSEYTAPDDFLCVQQIEHSTRFNNRAVNDTKNAVRIERLFQFAGDW